MKLEPTEAAGERKAAATFWQTALVGDLMGAAMLAVALAVIVLAGRWTIGSGVMINLLVTSVAVIGLQIFSGSSGIISFGHAGFVALGAYVSGLLTLPAAMKASTLPNLPSVLQGIELPFVVALLATMVVVGIAAAVIGVVIARLSGYAAAIASLGVLVIVHAFLLGMPDYTRGAQTFYGIAPLTTFPAALVAALVAIFVARIFRGSRAGLQLRASREDELASQSFGVNVRLRRWQAWVLGAMLAAVAGALLAHFITAFSPKQFYLAMTFNFIVMLIIGGPATVTGAVGGTVIVVFINELLRQFESGFTIGSISVGPIFGATQVIVALIMLLVMYFRRDGLFGLREPDEILASWLRRRQATHDRSGQNENRGGVTR